MLKYRAGCFQFYIYRINWAVPTKFYEYNMNKLSIKKWTNLILDICRITGGVFYIFFQFSRATAGAMWFIYSSTKFSPFHFLNILNIQKIKLFTTLLNISLILKILINYSSMLNTLIQISFLIYSSYISNLYILYI